MEEAKEIQKQIRDLSGNFQALSNCLGLYLEQNQRQVESLEITLADIFMLQELETPEAVLPVQNVESIDLSNNNYITAPLSPSLLHQIQNSLLEPLKVSTTFPETTMVSNTEPASSSQEKNEERPIISEEPENKESLPITIPIKGVRFNLAEEGSSSSPDKGQDLPSRVLEEPSVENMSNTLMENMDINDRISTDSPLLPEKDVQVSQTKQRKRKINNGENFCDVHTKNILGDDSDRKYKHGSVVLRPTTQLKMDAKNSEINNNA